MQPFTSPLQILWKVIMGLWESSHYFGTILLYLYHIDISCITSYHINSHYIFQMILSHFILCSIELYIIYIYIYVHMHIYIYICCIQTVSALRQHHLPAKAWILDSRPGNAYGDMFPKNWIDCTRVNQHNRCGQPRRSHAFVDHFPNGKALAFHIDISFSERTKHHE